MDEGHGCCSTLAIVESGSWETHRAMLRVIAAQDVIVQALYT
jgi:hypothetical protein